MDRLQGREEIIETWLAEADSDFYTDAVVNNALDHELRRFCAETGAGPAAEFLYSDANGTKRSWDLPTELVDVWRVDYDTTKDVVPFMPFQRFSLAFGPDWMADTSTGQPDAFALFGSHGIIFHPIPANAKTWRLYGPIIPDKPASDSTTWQVLDADGYTIVARAYVWMIERNLNRLGREPANYQRAIEVARIGTEEAKRRIRRMYGGIRIGGTVRSASTATSWDFIRRYGPAINWNW